MNDLQIAALTAYRGESGSDEAEEHAKKGKSVTHKDLRNVEGYKEDPFIKTEMR